CSVCKGRSHSIPRVFTCGRLERFEYLAMELLGMDLDNVRTLRHLPLPTVNILVVADQMIAALEFIHKNGVVRCDMKAVNILLHPTDLKCLYLVDYGLAWGYYIYDRNQSFYGCTTEIARRDWYTSVRQTEDAPWHS
ncbi:kinase-like domain-containing protein, partial [Suillus paluster]|uniref:kinase-like domain-containing protein n=1 Tax=Suillus paluster TaxID=48578 RepID=UPI001B869896